MSINTRDIVFKLDEKHRYIIDYSNLKDGLFNSLSNDFCSFDDLNQYDCNVNLGIPFLLPVGMKEFRYFNDETFILDKLQIAQKVFNTNCEDYLGVDLITKKGLTFTQYGEPREEFDEIINLIREKNKSCIDLVSNLRKKNKTICAFQTRNIPHIGHERIIQEGLKFSDYVVINPVIGVRKEGDIKPHIIERAFNYLIDNYYGDNVIYSPIIANMFYAGPREACHHTILRQNIGFTHFIVGRDHAGAENIYGALEASKAVQGLDIGIDIISIEGAYYCNKQKRAVIKGIDDYDNDSIKEISGSNFRNAFKNNKDFQYMRNDLFNYIKGLKEDIFE